MKISYIIPTYNCGIFLKECVVSIIRADAYYHEIIIVDDCSTDETKIIVDDLLKKFKNIKYFRNDRNRGCSYSRNYGLINATGDFCSFIDADDLVDANFGKVCFQFESQNFDAIYFGYKCIVNRRNIDEQSEIDLNMNNKIWLKKDINYLVVNLLHPEDNLLKKCSLFSPWGGCYSRIFLLDNGICFDESMTIAEDVKFNIEVIKRANRIVTNGYISYYYYKNVNSSGRSYNNNAISIGVDANNKINLTLGGMLSDYNVDKANNYSIIYRFWWTIVSDFYHMDNEENVLKKEKRLKKLYNIHMYKEAFAKLDREVIEFMPFNMKLIIVLIKHKMFFLGAVICKGRIVWAKMRKAFKIK